MTPRGPSKGHVVMSVRIPKALHQWLKTKAGEEYVSMNTKLIQIIKKESTNEDH